MFSKRSLFGLMRNTIGNKRCFWQFVSDSFNQFDDERTKEMGPNLACAEWLMKNGAKVRCKNSSQFVGHYDFLPTKHDSYLKQFKIEQVYAGTEASISHLGFLHFKGCDNISDIAFVGCNTIDNEALHKLQILKESLTSLEIDYCVNISDEGIIELEHLQRLKHLQLKNLNLKREYKIINHLKSKLHDCKIEYNEK